MPEQPKIQFTPAQAAAISARGGSLLVSAAAGSGKTRVLVERVVGLITDPVHPVDANQLLIMTFTNAAAAKLLLPTMLVLIGIIAIIIVAAVSGLSLNL